MYLDGNCKVLFCALTYFLFMFINSIKINGWIQCIIYQRIINQQINIEVNKKSKNIYTISILYSI